MEYPSETVPEPAISTVAANNNLRPTGALADLIRSRDFVIDFPRVFVLEGGSETRRRSTVFQEGIPERSIQNLTTLSLMWRVPVVAKVALILVQPVAVIAIVPS